MAKLYSCDSCGETLIADRETTLVERVQDHAETEHEIEVEAENIRKDIEDS